MASKKVKNLVFLFILNCTNVYSFTTKNINVHYWEIKPYIYLDDGKVTGIFPKYLMFYTKSAQQYTQYIIINTTVIKYFLNSILYIITSIPQKLILLNILI